MKVPTKPFKKQQVCPLAVAWIPDTALHNEGQHDTQQAPKTWEVVACSQNVVTRCLAVGGDWEV